MAVRTTYQAAYRADQTYVHGNPMTAALPPSFVLENYLAGLPLRSTATGADLQGIVQQKIDAAIGEFETRMGTFLVPRQIIGTVMGQQPQQVVSVGPSGYANLGPPAQPGVDFDLLEIPYAYTTRRFSPWSMIQTRPSPLIAVQRGLYALPPSFGILAVPSPWIVPSPTGLIQIVPVQGAMAITSPGAGMWLPFFTMGQMDHVPQFTQVAYTAGVSPVPDDMVDAVAQLATAKVLEVYNTAYYPGVATFSNSSPGFAQSVTLRSGGPFSERIKDLKQNADDYIKSWRSSHVQVRARSLGR